MELSYKQLERTLMTHLRIHPDREGTFKSRIKQLQRMEFPSGVNIGRGAKMVYNAAHLFELVTAFELIGTGLPADRVVNRTTGIVPNAFPVISYGFGIIAHHNARMRSQNNIYAVLNYQGLSDLQYNDNDPPAMAFALADSNTVEHMLFKRDLFHEGKTFHVMNLSKIYSSVIGAAYSAKAKGMHAGEPEVKTWIRSKKIIFGQEGKPPSWLRVSFNPYDYDEKLGVDNSTQDVDRFGASFRNARAEELLIALSPDPATGFQRAFVRLPENRALLLESSAYPLIDADIKDAKKIVELIRSHVERVSPQVDTMLYSNRIDFVACYIPSRIILQIAEEEDPGLWDWAFERRVLLVTRHILDDIARTIAGIWASQEESHQNLRPPLRAFFERFEAQPGITAMSATAVAPQNQGPFPSAATAASSIGAASAAATTPASRGAKYPKPRNGDYFSYPSTEDPDGDR